MKERIILHIDVNNAFLSWTAVDLLKKGSKIDIRNRYSIIGGDESQRRGIVLAKSYPCKNKGVITAEPVYSARRKCPYLELYKPDYELYQKYSDLMYNYLCTYTNIIERYSVDECFLDYTNSTLLFGDPIKTAYKIKEDIKRLYGFTVNVGIGNNKLCAKMASDFSKPDKVHTLFKDEIKTKMWPLDVSELFMIGKKTSTKLKELNINTIEELANCDLLFLTKHFKNMGTMMWESANGIDNTAVEYEEHNPKSVSTSTVLPYNYQYKEDIFKILKHLSLETGKRLRENKMYAGNVSIWIKYSDFNHYGKQIKLDNVINSDIDIYNNSINLFNKLWNEEPVRSLCVGVSGLSETKKVQLDLFNQNSKEKENLQKTIDNINLKYKTNMITYADILKDKK